MSRKDKQKLKCKEREANRFDNGLNSIADVGDFEELSDLTSQHHRRGADSAADGGGPLTAEVMRKALAGDADNAKALRSAMTSFLHHSGAANGAAAASSSSSLKKRARHHDDEDRAEDTHPVHDHDDGDDADDADDEVFEEFARKKKEFGDLKRAHYGAAPRYGGLELSVEDGEKRAASHEIMRNKGLMPHRKKLNRNPRVKKRVAYQKAVVARRGQVRDVASGVAAAYGGELTGIKANLSRSRKMG